jgi:hypothetical protein
MAKTLARMLLVFFMGIASAVAASATIKVREAWIRPAPQGRNTALYMKIDNQGEKEVALIKVTTDVADDVQLHETRQHGDIMKMHHLDKIICQPGEVTELKAGGLHVMLMHLKQDLKADKGQMVPVTLIFSDGHTIALEAPITKGECCHACHDHE